jgi:tRNA A37 threonylcarbamoyltransferase TsaD
LFGFEGIIPSPACRKAALNLENWITKATKESQETSKKIIELILRSRN